MSRVLVRPFEADDLAPAGALLARRHRCHRQSVPLLSPRFEDSETASAEVALGFAAAEASGAVAERGGDIVGFLLGAHRPDDRFGPNVWVHTYGHAVTEAETIRDLYAVAAEGWVEQGYRAHYVMVPATDAELVRAWFRLGFGQQQVHGIRPARSEVAPASGRVTVRRATRDDVEALARLDLELPRHQRRSPTFSATPLGSYEESLDEWQLDIEGSTYHAFVAEFDGAVVGSAVGCALDESSGHTSLARPDHAGFLAFAAVDPRFRGLGAGRSLGEAVIAWAGEAGYDSVVTDWRATNLLSSRAWPALGFTEYFLRLHRLVGY
jgi:ribosomal protein S18 acetylase RimI-like enzyme